MVTGVRRLSSGSVASSCWMREARADRVGDTDGDDRFDRAGEVMADRGGR